MRTAAAALALALIAAAPAAALEPLSQERYINDRLIAARVADRAAGSDETARVEGQQQ